MVSTVPVETIVLASVHFPRGLFINRHGLLFIVVGSGILYALLGLGVLGLTFYCLSSMPQRAYTTMNWLAWIPHVS
jgi:hypothetical protein